MLIIIARTSSKEDERCNRDWQDRSVAAGSSSSAAGRFQIIRRTMDSLIDNGTISRDDIFNEETQMKAYTDLLDRRGYSKFRTSIAAAETPEDKTSIARDFQLRLAKEFASIPFSLFILESTSSSSLPPDC